MAEGGAYLSQGQSQESLGEYDADPESVSQGSRKLHRLRSDKSTKSDDARHRRTIIIEKQNGTYGFTLQSYGIHYKKEHEVEMITYVDYIEYGGPAYKSGMREGDVILSINGTDMEKAEHKKLVTFIKNCDTRMRIVVLFEDCVRKVELHMRYVQLQNVLQAKMNELERTCLKEREIIEGKWKTHSLPARKKTNAQATGGGGGDVTSPTTEEAADMLASAEQIPATVIRPISTEDVNVIRYQKRSSHIIAPPVQFMLTYQYLDPRYRYVLRPSTSNSSGEYLLANIGPPPRSKSDHHQCYLGSQPHIDREDDSTSRMSSEILADVVYDERPAAPKTKADGKKASKSGRHFHGFGHACTPCIWHKSDKSAAAGANNGDNVSLDAYDLASPCCNPNCVPTRRRVKHKEHKHKHREKDSSKSRLPKFFSSGGGNTGDAHQSRETEPHHHHHHHHHHGTKKQDPNQPYDLSSDLTSHCSLHSCLSANEYDAVHDNQSASYSTSVSTDTLYWDPNSETSLIKGQHQHSTKSRKSDSLPKSHSMLPKTEHYHHHHRPPPLPHPQSHHYHHMQQTASVTCTKIASQNKVGDVQMQPQYLYHKPKSWDNLAMKAFGGYGFGYGYLDKAAIPKSHGNLVPPPIPPKSAAVMNSQSMPRKTVFGRYSTHVENYAPPPTQFVHGFATSAYPAAKSTENLLGSYKTTSNASIDRGVTVAACGCTVGAGDTQTTHQCSGYYSHLPKKATATIKSGVNPTVATVSEITRL